jgi:two-component system, NtrC family, sensor kinase
MAKTGTSKTCFTGRPEHRAAESDTLRSPQMASPDVPAVLYVDDEAINLRVFEANFKHRFRIVTCGSGAEALERVRGLGEVAVLVSDQRMPGMTGVELLEKARELLPDAQRMVITAYSDMQAVMDAVNRGQVSRYFVKPWVKEDLLAALEDALRVHGLQLRLREMQARLLQAERLATLGQVSAGIAHELMNPVSYLTQNVEAMRGELAVLSRYLTPLLGERPDPAVAEALQEIPHILDDVETGSRHIRQVALGIRNQARGQDVEETSDMADVAGFVSKLARAEVRHRGQLMVRGLPCRVHGGPVKLSQVLLNLIVNAAQALDEGVRGGRIELGWEAAGEAVRVWVADNGRGIPVELQERVFEPLFTTKPVGVGTGLGLSICRELVTEMGGALTLMSEVGKGTTVALRLRRAVPAPSEP